MWVAFANIALKTGSSAPGELLMTCNTSEVAVCCSSDCLSSLSSVPCGSLVYDVETFASFFTAITPPRTNGSGQFVDANGNPITAQFVPGSAAGSIVVGESGLPTEFIIGLRAARYLGYQGGTVLSSTVVFENEP